MRVNILGENQCVITLNNIAYLQSYRSIVAAKKPGLKVLYPKWDYSRTTAKHVGQFFNTSAAEIRSALKKGNPNFILEEHEPEL